MKFNDASPELQAIRKAAGTFTLNEQQLEGAAKVIAAYLKEVWVMIPRPEPQYSKWPNDAMPRETTLAFLVDTERRSPAGLERLIQEQRLSNPLSVNFLFSGLGLLLRSFLHVEVRHRRLDPVVVNFN